MIVKGYGGRIVVLGFVLGQGLHGFQGSAEAVHSADQADAHAQDQDPDAKVEPLPQPDGQ